MDTVRVFLFIKGRYKSNRSLTTDFLYNYNTDTIGNYEPRSVEILMVRVVL